MSSEVIDFEFWKKDAARRIADAFGTSDQEQWTHYAHVNEDKLAQTDRGAIPPPVLAAIDVFNRPEFVAIVSAITGIEGLFPDPTLEGGGMHMTHAGGFLNIHADFTGHPHHETWERRVNPLLYFNEEWHEEYGDHLELWATDASRFVQKVAPHFSRCVIFTTDSRSFHGHPEPLRCPPDKSRRSLALYYFTESLTRAVCGRRNTARGRARACAGDFSFMATTSRFASFTA